MQTEADTTASNDGTDGRAGLLPRLRFRGKRVIVTGAASGIGAATVRRFVAEGARVAAVDSRRVVGTPEPDPMVQHLECDVSRDEDAFSAVSDTVDWIGGIDVLVDAAGYPVTEARDGMTEAEWRAHFEADVHGIRFMTEHARSCLSDVRGSIVNVTSVAGLGGDKFMEAYNAARGAAVRLTNAQSIDLGPEGIRVNAVCPTITRTAMSRKVEARPDLMKRLQEHIPLGRIGEAEEIASVIAFLASDEASFVTGAAVPVDGGVTARNGQPILI